MVNIIIRPLLIRWLLFSFIYYLIALFIDLVLLCYFSILMYARVASFRFLLLLLQLLLLLMMMIFLCCFSFLTP